MAAVVLCVYWNCPCLRANPFYPCIYLSFLQKMEVLGVLEGHLGALTAAEFYSWDGDFLVSVSEDRTFWVH